MEQSRGQARVGVFVPYTNTNLEADMMLLRPPGVSFHFARLGGYDQDEIPTADQMAGLGQQDLDEPIRLLLGCRPHVILYGCTSATLSLGPDFDQQLAARIRSRSDIPTVTAAGAVIAALKHLRADHIAFASPYVKEINDLAVAFLQDSGITTVSRFDFDGRLDNYGQSALTPAQVFELGCQADSERAQAVVLSCTDMRGVEVIACLERRLGKPVVTSNQALLFEALQLLQFADGLQGFGQLLENA